MNKNTKYQTDAEWKINAYTKAIKKKIRELNVELEYAQNTITDIFDIIIKSSLETKQETLMIKYNELQDQFPEFDKITKKILTHLDNLDNYAHKEMTIF
jgi:hypothetical protein